MDNNKDTQWVRCTHCNHKLFQLNQSDNQLINISIKCHSCKTINNIIIKGTYVPENKKD